MIAMRRSMPTSVSGRWGEAAARVFLQRRGCEVLERNFRTQYGEIDLIVRDGRTIVFVEVKLRARDTGAAEAAVDMRKQRRILFAARVYSQCARAEQYRCDVIVVIRAPGSENARIRQYRNAFDMTIDC
jgi:putative endonuclease